MTMTPEMAEREAVAKAIEARREKRGPMVAADAQPNFVWLAQPKKRRQRPRGAFSRVVLMRFEDTPDGMGRLHYLHPTKGWRVRAATPALFQQLINR